jgi:hypothetical protein
MAYGAIDLFPGASADDWVAAFERGFGGKRDVIRPVEVWVAPLSERTRITVFADWGNPWFGQAVAGLADGVERAVVGLDHDEYGVEHVVLDGRGGALVRVHHVYVYPDGEMREEYAPLLAGLPARPDLTANVDGTLTGADALAVAAALYDVGAAAMIEAVRATAVAYESLQIVFEPLAPWWHALGLTYPIPDLGDPTLTLPSPTT